MRPQPAIWRYLNKPYPVALVDIYLVPGQGEGRGNRAIVVDTNGNIREALSQDVQIVGPEIARHWRRRQQSYRL